MTNGENSTQSSDARLDIAKAEVVYFNFGDDRDEVQVDRPIELRKVEDGTCYVKSADGYVTMISRDWMSADIIPLPGESVFGK